MQQLAFVPVDPEAFNDRYLIATLDEPDLTLGALLTEHPALSLQPLEPEHLDLTMKSVTLRVARADPRVAMYCPPGIGLSGVAGAAVVGQLTDSPASPSGAPLAATTPGAAGAVPARAEPSRTEAHPARVSDREAVLIAHDAEIGKAAAYLNGSLSVLIRCEKLLVEHLIAEIPGRAGRKAQVAELPPDLGNDLAGMGGRRAALLSVLAQVVRDAKPEHVIVVPHLDLLAGGSDAGLSAEARELTDVLYSRSDCILLGFTDPSLMIPEVLADRFSVRLAIDILPRMVSGAAGAPRPVSQALITEAEAALFEGFEAVELYKHVAGMSAVRLRHALRYAFHQHHSRAADGSVGPTFADLLDELRSFKAKTSSAFELPRVSFGQIGGYEPVKATLARAIEIIGGAAELPDNLRHDLVPRGFIFHGPPGTGKTLFAMAVANELRATVQVVSGPEITDMYVGESERKVRELFAEARRNAPTVLVFDEFDSIAARRSGRSDGGSRAGNAIVAQLLTELDGFRPEVPVLVIGTTNRIDIIDDALLRPSRFKPVRIDLPDELARREIAAVHARHFGVTASDRLLDRISRATDKMNGDEIRSIFRDARADELVGHPRRPADARRLGELVGELRRAQQEHRIDVAGNASPSRAHTARSMVTLTGRRPVADPVAGDIARAPGAGGPGTGTNPNQPTPLTEEDQSGD